MAEIQNNNMGFVELSSTNVHCEHTTVYSHALALRHRHGILGGNEGIALMAQIFL